MEDASLENRVRGVEYRLTELEKTIPELIGLEENLKQRLKLADVKISLNPDLGPAAADVFQTLVRPEYAAEFVRRCPILPEENILRRDWAMPPAEQLPDDQPLRLGIAFSGGRAICSMVNHITVEYSDLNVYPLSCAGLPGDVAFSVNTVIGLFCWKNRNRKVSGTGIPVDPTLLGHIGADCGQRIRDGMLNDIKFRVHYAFTGIGGVGDNDALPKLARAIGLPADLLANNRVIGDMLYRAININGGRVQLDELDSRIIGVDPTLLAGLREDKNLPLDSVVGVAGGKGKENAIYAACRGGLINILVTDIDTAKRLAERPEIP